MGDPGPGSHVPQLCSHPACLFVPDGVPYTWASLNWMWKEPRRSLGGRAGWLWLVVSVDARGGTWARGARTVLAGGRGGSPSDLAPRLRFLFSFHSVMVLEGPNFLS